jgi:hypothetical protein
MAARGLPVSAAGVAWAYREWLDVMVLDRRDQGLTPDLLRLGVSPVVEDTLMTDRRREVALARAVLEALG